jgi:hypothetical protein
MSRQSRIRIRKDKINGSTTLLHWLKSPLPPCSKEVIFSNIYRCNPASVWNAFMQHRIHPTFEYILSLTSTLFKIRGSQHLGSTVKYTWDIILYTEGRKFPQAKE